MGFMGFMGFRQGSVGNRYIQDYWEADIGT